MADTDNGKYHTILIRVSHYEYAQFLKYKEQGLSARKVLECCVQPCEHCKNISVITYDKNDNLVIVKKGILKEK